MLDKIEALELELTAEDIIFFRTLVEIQMTKEKEEAEKKKKKEEKSGGWFSKKKDKKDEEEDEKDKTLDEASKKELYDLIDYDPATAGTAAFPPEFVVTRFNFSLDRCSLMFAEVGHVSQHILHTSLDRVSYVL